MAYITKGIGGFYYVKTPDGIVECKARGIFRKRGITPVAGDNVTLSADGTMIDEILPRKNVFIRPPIANLDILFIVTSTTQPVPSTLVLDQLAAAAIYKDEQPVLEVGSEVPIPGGSLVHEDSVTPTSPVEIARQLAAIREAFAQKGLPFGQVIGFVAQPGVEFGDDFVNAYAPRRAAGLIAQMRGCPALVLESHSTDYQTRESLSSLVRDGVAILKVGPALTFALREALMLAQQAAGRMGVNVDFTGALENAMLADDRYWKSYYSGTEREVAYKRLFSFSDRCRYYLPGPGVEQAVQTLRTQCGDLPPALLSLYFPRQYTKYRNGQLGSDLRAVILDRIGDVLDDYAAACFPALFE